MRVSNVGRINYRPVKMQDRPEGGFSDLVKLELEKICNGSEEYDPEHTIIIKCKAWGRKFDTNEELSRYYPHCSLPMEADLVHVDLSALTDEKKAELNEKYQISSIKAYSKEYFALMKDLQEMGVLSDGSAYQLPPNMHSLAIDENGRVKSFSVQYLYEKCLYEDSWKKGNFLDYTKNALSFVADDFEEMKKWDWLTDEEQMALSVYEMNQNIVAAIEEIFAGQLNMDK